MGERKEEDLYRNFSRKDLQGLCKKYGLPANKSNSEMATSLILYLEKKNLSSRAIWEGTRSDFFASGMTKLQGGVKMNSSNEQKKDSGHIASHSGFMDHRHRNRRVANHNDLQKYKGFASFDKASEDVGNLTQLYRESNSGAGIQENTFSSVVSSSAVAPSPTFTYDVYCENGIQLYVDLNSSASDWIDNLKAGVHICHHVHKPVLQSLNQDIGLLSLSKKKNGSGFMDPSKDADNGLLEVGSYPPTVVADIQAQRDEPDVLEDLSNTFNSLHNSKEGQTILSSKPDSGAQFKLTRSASSRKEDTLAADSGLNVDLQTGICGDYQGNSMPSVPKCSEFPVHHGASTGDGAIYDKPPLQQTNGSLDDVLKCGEASTSSCMEMLTFTTATLSYGFDNSPSGIHRGVGLTKKLKKSKIVKSVAASVRDELQSWPVQAVDQCNFVSLPPVMNSPLHILDGKSKVEPQQGITSFSRKTDRDIKEAQTHSAENAGCHLAHEADGGIDEVQEKNAAQHSCCNGGPFDLVVPAQKGGDHRNSSESIEDDICRISSTADVVKLCTRDPGSKSEGLKCLNNKEQLEAPCKRTAGSESGCEVKRKRHINGIEGQRKVLNSESKVLRSSKQSVGDVHSKRRRSSRLFTKV